MSRKTTKIISLFVVALFLLGVVSVLLPREMPTAVTGYKTRMIYSHVPFDCEPNKAYYTEFQLSVDPEHPSKVFFKVNAEKDDANLTWYLMQTDAATFKKEKEVYSHVITYENTISNQVEGTVSVENPGTYLFVFLQTNQESGSQSIVLELKADEWMT
ncbi:MAG: hypothetical protein GTN80_07800 [Nitrososphaeria archaeon]|nr:hypothetical protein [Nitrososphaeria archaeon]NIN52967.1 hypothetical protein [Nitrososphaeria archaeon]NIQ33526.1 hypothetical protein [Nitrososphaeria archaeon]